MFASPGNVGNRSIDLATLGFTNLGANASAMHSEPLIMPFPPRKAYQSQSQAQGSQGGTPPRRQMTTGGAGMTAKEKQAAIEDGTFFASSVFQNSPSPDELPPPPF
jgi:hypothetical protein